MFSANLKHKMTIIESASNLNDSSEGPPELSFKKKTKKKVDEKLTSMKFINKRLRQLYNKNKIYNENLIPKIEKKLKDNIPLNPREISATMMEIKPHPCNTDWWEEKMKENKKRLKSKHRELTRKSKFEVLLKQNTFTAKFM
jgi:hypothetical protein